MSKGIIVVNIPDLEKRGNRLMRQHQAVKKLFGMNSFSNSLCRAAIAYSGAKTNTSVTRGASRGTDTNFCFVRQLQNPLPFS